VSLSLEGGSGEAAVNNQNIDFEDVGNDSFENMFEMAKYEPDNKMYWEMSTDEIKHLLKL